MREYIRDYEKAARRLRECERDLQSALDKHRAALDDDRVTDMTPWRLPARKAERACALAYEEAERARKAYWREMARLAENELIRVSLPLLGIIEHHHKAGDALVHPVHTVLSRLGALQRLPYAAAAAEVPDGAIESEAMDRAEEQVL